MDTPSPPLGLLITAGLVWQMAAYLGAALAALRIFSAIRSARAPRPFCVIAAVTRCLIGARPLGAPVAALDMLRFAALLIFAVSLAITGLTARYFLSGAPQDADLQALLWVLCHIALGSGIMIALTGAHRHIVEGRADAA
jgi:hypothetical protein